MTEIVFYILAAAAVLGGAMCVLQRSPVASALWLMSTMFSLACIYVLLGAQLIGVLQILVYVGAILVLFLFVIMLLNLGRATPDTRGPSGMTATIAIVGLLLVEILGLAAYTPARLASEVTGAPGADPAAVFPAGQLAQLATQQRGVVGGLAEPLFQAYLVPFEITSILLLAALVGAVVLAKRRV
ncbi:MAG TPA: NADH-quinone oxidoreductase subunit J [Gemmatimonadales bacterium]|nr:NADH-quinone oxidoreductase subunit J [Gemmatimonadales bacterium]